MSADNLSRAFCLVSYVNLLTEAKGVLESHPVECCYSIWHYMDVDDNGVEKKPHYHLFLYIKNATTAHAVSKWFSDVDSNVFVQVARNVGSAIRYLCHLDSPEKVQYPLGNVLLYGDRTMFYKAVREASNEFDSSFLALKDLLGGCSLYRCAKKYGRDFIYHYGALKDLRDDINLDKNSFQEMGDDVSLIDTDLVEDSK